VSRFTSGKITLHKEPTDLAGVVARAIETARPAIDSRRHELSVTLPPERLRLEADPVRLAQVFENLLNNAAKYTPQGGRIALHAQREGREAAVRVRDTGIGIPAYMLTRVFDLFTQVDRTLDHAQGGLGIGLTLVKKLVELHGGTVEAASVGLNQGSEFIVRLPLLPDPGNLETGCETEKGQVEPPVRRRVLVVDDNLDAADSLAKLLELHGQEVRVVNDGPAALEAIPTYRPEVVLLDIGLPGIDGYEVARRLRAQPATAQALLVALTGYGREEDRCRSRDAGFDNHLVKPVEPQAVLRLLALPLPHHAGNQGGADISRR
jgi:CheY-like chemotaxis protein